MSTCRFSTRSRFRWQGIIYEVKRLLPGGQVSIEELLTGTRRVVELSMLVQALFDGELAFVIEGKPARGEVKEEISIENRYVTLGDCPEHLLCIARRRLEIIEPLVAIAHRTEAMVRDRVQEIRLISPQNSTEHTLEDALSVRSVYRWLDDYTRSGHDLRALIPDTGKRGGKGQSRLALEVEALLSSVIEDRYYVRERVTTDDIRAELAVRLEEENLFRLQHERLKLPSRSTVARRIGNLSTRETFAAKHGKQAAKREFAQYGKTEYPTLPLERVEIDHTKSDLIVIDDHDNLPLGRLTLTYCLDTATRYPLGYYMGFEPPSYLSAMECLHHAIRPKESVREKYGTEHDWITYGIPATLVIDNGKEFIGRDLQDACLLLGIVLQQTPVKTPHFKAAVERLYGSLNTMFFHTLPGTTFSNIRKRGDYDSTKQACVYLSDVDKMLNILIVDVYAERFHRGLEGIPARRWQELTRHGFAPALPPSAEELSILLGRTAQRVVHHYGIEYASLRYNCDELVPLRTKLKGEKAKIKYHPADLSHLYVHDPFEGRYIQVPALDQEYTHGLSLWKHRVIRRVVLSEQDSVDIAALGRAKRKIQELVDEGRRRKRQSVRSRIARWETAGKPTRQVVDEADANQAIHESSEAITRSKPSTDLLPPPPDGETLLSTDTDWEISYSLPSSRHDVAETSDGEMANG
jgi:putative transposase